MRTDLPMFSHDTSVESTARLKKETLYVLAETPRTVNGFEVRPFQQPQYRMTWRKVINCTKSCTTVFGEHNSSDLEVTEYLKKHGVPLASLDVLMTWEGKLQILGPEFGETPRKVELLPLVWNP